MEVEFAFLAEAAKGSTDNLVYVIGGGLDTLGAAELPVGIPALSVIVKLKLQPIECDREHKLEIELWDEDGAQAGPKLDLAFSASRRPEHPARPVYLQVVLNLQQLQFPKYGDYAFQIVVDGLHLKVMPLYIEQPPAVLP